MPKTDWQALDARIAREVMGWKLQRYSKAPTFDAQRMAWFLPVGKERQLLQFKMWQEDWQPHIKVAQALKVKDKIVAQGWWFELRATPDMRPSACIWRPRRQACPSFEASAKTDAAAIMRAAEQWMGAQKEKQDEPARS